MVKYNPSSLYRNTSIVNDKYLDILEMEIDPTLTYELNEYEITNKHENRPDLLAFELYGEPRLWWVFAEFNQDKLLDPILDFKAGLKIQVPARFS